MSFKLLSGSSCEALKCSIERWMDKRQIEEVHWADYGLDPIYTRQVVVYGINDPTVIRALALVTGDLALLLLPEMPKRKTRGGGLPHSLEKFPLLARRDDSVM